MFHVSNGLFFQKCDDGNVLIVVTVNGELPADNNVLTRINIDPDSWRSVVIEMEKEPIAPVIEPEATTETTEPEATTETTEPEATTETTAETSEIPAPGADA